MSQKPIIFQNRSLSNFDLDEACDILLTPNFTRISPPDQVMKLFEFCRRNLTTKPPTNKDFRYATLMLEYGNFLLMCLLPQNALPVSELSYKLLQRVNFDEDLKNDDDRMGYFRSLLSYVRSRLQISPDVRKTKEMYKEVLEDIESKTTFSDPERSKSSLAAQIYLELGMMESSLSPFPSPVCRTYFEKAIIEYEKAKDINSVLHCKYKIAEWYLQNAECMKKAMKAIKKDNISKDKLREIAKKRFEDGEDFNVDLIENVPKRNEEMVGKALHMIDECIENYTKDKNERNVFLNMKHVKCRILFFLDRMEESYILIERIIHECLLVYNLQQVMVMGYLMTKSKILMELGPKYWKMSLKCLETCSRFESSQGNAPGTEQIKLVMKEVQKKIDESGLSKSEFMKESILPFKTCCYPHCGKKETKPSEFKCCSRCQSCVYCSRKCQARHWKIAHKRECKKWEKKIDENEVIKTREKILRNLDNGIEKLVEDQEESEKILEEMIIEEEVGNVSKK